MAKRSRKAGALEQEIATAEERMKEIDTLLCDAEIYADGARSRELLSERDKIERSLPTLYEKW